MFQNMCYFILGPDIRDRVIRGKKTSKFLSEIFCICFKKKSIFIFSRSSMTMNKILCLQTKHKDIFLRKRNSYYIQIYQKFDVGGKQQDLIV